jgi:hypothetical protein
MPWGGAPLSTLDALPWRKIKTAAASFNSRPRRECKRISLTKHKLLEMIALRGETQHPLLVLLAVESRDL